MYVVAVLEGTEIVHQFQVNVKHVVPSGSDSLLHNKRLKTQDLDIK